MARPQRNSVDYFPFYCEEGKKMYYLEETYGNDGFATFVKLLRELAKTDYHYLDLSKNTTMMFLSAKCKVSLEILKSIINDLVNLEKFDRVLWEENSIIWCQDFTNSIEDAYSKRKNKCITYDGLLHLLDSLGVRKLSKSKSKGGINPQSKEEYSKVNKSIEDRKAEFKNSLLPFLDKYGKDLLNDFFGYWTEHGDKDKKMRFEKEKSFSKERRLSTWLKNQKRFKKIEKNGNTENQPRINRQTAEVIKSNSEGWEIE